MKPESGKKAKMRLWPAIGLAVLFVLAAGAVCYPTVWESTRPIVSAPLFAPDTEDTVNINTATLQELQVLPGIGEQKAAAILRFREENGSFTSIQQLLQVEGIGNGILESIKDLVSL